MIQSHSCALLCMLPLAIHIELHLHCQVLPLALHNPDCLALVNTLEHAGAEAEAGEVLQAGV